ncbi:MAG: D-glycero-beta-D-manno-heptose-7-phosphate kinase [Proteobacteria bacterium]|nr:D-glycero-beta-D-manno-heptose-7-phosphate kinase [Pseudomonadota bacterium]
MPTRFDSPDPYPLHGASPLNGGKVAILGDVMVDRFVWGSVDRISPEAPVPVVRVTRRSTHLGGAGNVAHNVATLGAMPILIGRLGQDEMAKAFQELAFRQRVDTSLMTYSDVPTTSKTRVIARTQQVVRFDEEDTNIMTPALRGELLNNLRQARLQTDVLILSDYGKGIIDQEMLDTARELWADGTILADPKPRKGIVYKGVTGMTPNRSEARLLADEMPTDTDAQVEAAARYLMETYNMQHILITRSEQGMSLCLRSGQVFHMPTHAAQVVDVSGAGDTVMAVFATAISMGMRPERAAYLANLAGGVVVTKLGTATVTWEEILQKDQDNRAVAA